MAAGLTLDAGALIAAEKRSFRWLTIWRERQARGLPVTLPAVVFAQVWRGNSPEIARLLPACRFEAFDERYGRQVGELLAKSRTSDLVDAVVVLGALTRGDRIVTSDPGDIRRLLAAAGGDQSLVLEVQTSERSGSRRSRASRAARGQGRGAAATTRRRP